MDITLAMSNGEREEIIDLFARTFQDLLPDAVPSVELEHVFRPLVAQIRDDNGRLLAAAMTARAYRAAIPLLMPGVPMPGPDMTSVLDAHSELDLIAVDPAMRTQGMGSALIRFLQPVLVARGVRAWFGHAPDYLDVERLRRFYTRNGFKVLPLGQPLPPLLGKTWEVPGVQPSPGFHFYKNLSASAGTGPV